MSEREKVIQNIKLLAGLKKRQKLLLATLPDAVLYRVYKELKNGSSNRSIARMIKSKIPLNGSENSVAQSVAKLRKRLTPLIRRPAKAAKAQSANPKTTITNLSTFPLDERLERLREIEDSYARMIQETITANNESGVLPIDLHKHIQSLATLTKTRAKLEQAAAKGSRPLPEARDKHFDEQAQHVYDVLIGPDRGNMIKAAQKFLDRAVRLCQTYYFNEETQQYEPIETRKRVPLT